MIEPHPLANKRILFALCGFDLGGAERQALYLAKYLKGVGADVRVWGHHHEFHGPERVIVECEAAGIPWAEYKFRWPSGKKQLFHDLLHLLLGLYRERPDIILPYLPWLSIGCGLIWRLSPAKACIWGQRNAEDLNGDKLERFAYRQATAIICNAGHEIDYLRKVMGETDTPAHVIYNGVDLATPLKTRKQWRVALKIDAKAIVVSMVANFRPQKDHRTLLIAWQQLLERHREVSTPVLVLAGAPQESYRGIRNISRELGLEESVRFPGQVEDVAGLLEASDIGVLITDYEGLPNAILEYMTCGLPVVATDVPGNREALGEDSGKQFCKVKNAEDLADKLFSLISSPELRFRLGSRNRQRAITEFSIETMCSRMTEILVGTLKKKA